MQPMPIHLASEHGHPAHGAQVNIDWYASWQPSRTIAVACRDGQPLLLRDCPIEDVAGLEWALYGREALPFGGWRMTDSGLLLKPVAEAQDSV